MRKWERIGYMDTRSRKLKFESYELREWISVLSCRIWGIANRCYKLLLNITETTGLWRLRTEDGGDLAGDSAAAKVKVKATWHGVRERAARSWGLRRGRSPGASPQRAVAAEPGAGVLTQLSGRESGGLLCSLGFPGGGRGHPKTGRVWQNSSMVFINHPREHAGFLKYTNRSECTHTQTSMYTLQTGAWINNEN